MDNIFSLILFFSLFSTARTITVFNFEGKEKTNPADISFLTLTTSPVEELPDKFTLCSSHLQGRADDVGPYQIYGQNGDPWLAFQFYYYMGHFDVWVYLGNYTELVGQVEGQIQLDQWYHTCLLVDTTGEGALAVSVNGKLLEITLSMSHTRNKPKSLKNKIILGSSITHRSRKHSQFLWSVTNIQIFKGVTAQLTGCRTRGNFLAWSDMAWIKEGGDIEELKLVLDDICTPKSRHSLVVPYEMQQDAAIRTCHKMPNGFMPTPANQSDFDTYVNWFGGLKPNICKYSWTPILYSSQENVYKNIEDNKTVYLQKLGESYPASNFGVVIHIAKKVMMHRATSQTKCFSCTFDRSNFLLRGNTCKTSFLGKKQYSCNSLEKTLALVCLVQL